MWISLGNHAKLALVFAQTGLGGDGPKHKGLACFLVETEGQDGFQPQEIKGKMGLWASDTAQIGLDDVIAPADSMLGEIGDGFKVAMSALDSGRYSVAAGCVGICQGSVEEATKYAKERHAFQRPIASFQLVQDMIAEMVVKTDAARLLVYRAGALKDKGAPSTTETSIAKFFATEAACWCADRAIQVHGGSGYADDFPVERFYRDAKLCEIGEGTSEIQRLVISRAVLR
jgi:alkylation response protein AidB-like acyl-CoA dehydrogenase